MVTKKSTVPLAGVLVGCVCGTLLLFVVILLFIRWYRQKKYRDTNYETMSTDSRVPVTTALSEASNLNVQPPMFLRQIPFTVPSHSTPPLQRRLDQTRLSEDGCSTTGSGSEPSSPITIKRPSVEIPGAYALGSIDPSLYKIVDEDEEYEIPDDHIGRVWFAVEYERESEKLLVTLIKAKNLPSRIQGNSNMCDPFARIFLMPDERRYLQSKFRKKTANPKFEESYVFQVSHKSIHDRVLKFSIFDVDRHKRHKVIGHALYPLKDHVYEGNERVVVWRDLEKEVSESTSDKGEMLVSLCYNNHLERLAVGVFEGRDFKSPEGGAAAGIIDTYMKVGLLVQNKVVKAKKTEVAKKTNNPTFNESFTFKLPNASLDTANITVTAMQQCGGYRDKSLGRIVLGSFMFARGKELEHWNDMIANQREQVTQWHVLT